MKTICYTALPGQRGQEKTTENGAAERGSTLVIKSAPLEERISRLTQYGTEVWWRPCTSKPKAYVYVSLRSRWMAYGWSKNVRNSSKHRIDAVKAVIGMRWSYYLLYQKSTPLVSYQYYANGSIYALINNSQTQNIKRNLGRRIKINVDESFGRFFELSDLRAENDNLGVSKSNKPKECEAEQKDLYKIEEYEGARYQRPWGRAEAWQCGAFAFEMPGQNGENRNIGSEPKKSLMLGTVQMIALSDKALANLEVPKNIENENNSGAEIHEPIKLGSFSFINAPFTFIINTVTAFFSSIMAALVALTQEKLGYTQILAEEENQPRQYASVNIMAKAKPENDNAVPSISLTNSQFASAFMPILSAPLQEQRDREQGEAELPVARIIIEMALKIPEKPAQQYDDIMEHQIKISRVGGKKDYYPDRQGIERRARLLLASAGVAIPPE